MANHDHDYSLSNGEVIPKDPQSGIPETTEERHCLICEKVEVFTESELYDEEDDATQGGYYDE